MYLYQTLPDETEIVHSHLIIEDGVQKVIVHFERPTEDGFDSARCSLPEYTWIFKHGYSTNEISFLNNFYTKMNRNYTNLPAKNHIKRKREKMMKEETFKNKILWYNFILCILVVCIHAQNMHIFIAPVTWINRSISFLVEQIACLAVPGFFMCSGYLFYRNLTWKKIPEKLKRRVVSLVIPFFIWNFLYYILHLTARKFPYLGQLFDTAVPFSLPEFINAVFFYKYNPVFWFMLYLILFSFLSPVIYGILKQKWIGLMVIFAVLILNFSAMLTPYLPINVNDVFSWSIYYLIGSYLGIHWKDAVTSKKPYIPALIFLVGSCISFIFTFVHIQTGWIYIYKVCGAAFLWYLICMLPLPEARTWMKNTFLIYAVHQIMALFLNKVGNLAFGNSMYIGGFIFLMIPVIVTVFCHYTGNILSKYCPVIWKLISGGRQA